MLELEFLPDGSPDCPLIRLSGAESSTYARLHDLIVRLSRGTIREVCIDRLPGIASIGASRVAAIAAK
jgi:hypothetical protein